MLDFPAVFIIPGGVSPGSPSVAFLLCIKYRLMIMILYYDGW